MSMIIAGIVGLVVGGGAVHFWHKTHPIKIGPNPNTGSGGQPGGPH